MMTDCNYSFFIMILYVKIADAFYGKTTTLKFFYNIPYIKWKNKRCRYHIVEVMLVYIDSVILLYVVLHRLSEQVEVIS